MIWKQRKTTDSCQLHKEINFDFNLFILGIDNLSCPDIQKSTYGT